MMKRLHWMIGLLCLGLLGWTPHVDKRDRPSVEKPEAVTGKPSTQWKYHNVGNLRLVVTNFGVVGRGEVRGLPEDFVVCEYPANSGIEHLYGGGIWVGAKIDTSTNPRIRKVIAAVTTGWEGWAGPWVETYPTDDPRDTIYVTSVNNLNEPNKRHFDDDGDGLIDEDELNGYDDDGDGLVDEDYGAVSDQDFICQYVDYFKTDIEGHVPLYIKIIQKSYAWSGGYAEAIIFFEYTIINMHETRTLEETYVGYFMDMDVGPIWVKREKGYPHSFWEVNYTAYIDSTLTAFIDNPVDKPSTPLGVTIVKTPKPLDSLKVSFHWYPGDRSPSPDYKRYEYLSDGVKMPSQSKSELSDTRFLFGFGPFTLKPGDKLHLVTALVSGMTVAEMLRNADRARSMYDNDYKVPPSPPSPPLKITLGNRKVFLNWKWEPGDPGVNPEEFVDTTNYTAARYLDGKVFEGYRLYRSEDPKGSVSSFTLIQEWDKPGNIWGYNFGLAHEYVDSNLVPGKTYWYAVTSFSIEDTVRRHRRESLESPILANATKVVVPFITSYQLGKVMVVPNPYRVDEDYTKGIRWEGDRAQWTEEKRLIKFIHLPPKCTIRIYSLTGDLIDVIYHDDPIRGEENWNLMSAAHRTIASGIYIFTVESEYGTQVGKFVVIK